MCALARSFAICSALARSYLSLPDYQGHRSLVYSHRPLHWRFNSLDLVEVLLNSGEFLEDRMFASLDAIESQICYEGHNNLQKYLDSEAKPDLEQKPINRTIHILGLGAAGKYVAHSLASLPFAPPITLLMHRPLMMQHWHDEGAAIHVIKGGDIRTQTNFHIESSARFAQQDSQQCFPGFGPRLEHTAEPPNYQISALIITTEAYRTISALTAIKHRLGRSSTILLLNNGLGLAERINERVFPDPYNRPTYILGNMSHNLESTERHFTLIEKSPGRLECSKFPQVSSSRKGRTAPMLTRKDFSWTAHASHLVGTLARTPEFRTATLGHKSFYESQLQTLAAGAVIGPLSVVFDCTNDLILYNYNASQTMKLLLREISRVIRSLPELQSLPDLDSTFSVKRLESIIVSKISKSGRNLSTMLQNVRAGNRTNIDYYNGYIERRARELGIDTPRNEMMLHLVRGKCAAKSRELNNYIPFEDDY
ncbi:ketopantoate reductase PanE/ApbA C terminal-domain-containing protein [Rhexocercosporidium sp. MPI-PUGE-AT-0058]|nr:ketopantoate reductase PanE/ApbA C terminal-domain-containing protein [Rhexocercosporidium sp. MPI-PUGE-AT-0058]